MSILKNIVQFTGLVVGVPVSLPHELNVNGNPVAPRLGGANAQGFTITANATNVTVTRTITASVDAVDVYVEHWHTIEDVLPLPGRLAGLTPFFFSDGSAPPAPQLVVEEDGVPLAGAPHNTLNFTGPGVTATDAGGGVADVEIPGATNYRTYTVAPDGSADFTSVAAAVNAANAQAPTPTNTWAVVVQPGMYTEPAFTINPGVILTSRTTGIGDADAVITAADPTQHFITTLGGSIGGVTLRGPTSPGKACILTSGLGSFCYLTSVTFSGPCAIAWRIEDGGLGGASNVIAQITDVGSEITESVYSVDGVGSQLLVSGTFCFVPAALLPFYAVNPIQNCLSVTNGGHAGIYSAVMQVAPLDNTQVNIYVDGGSLAFIYSVSNEAGWTGIRIGAGGANSEAYVQGGAFTDLTTNFQIDSATGKIFAMTMVDDASKKTIVPGGLLTGVFQNVIEQATQLAGNVDYVFPSEEQLALGTALHTDTNSGVISGGAVTDGGGLTVDVALGTGVSRYAVDGVANYSWAAVVGLALVANQTNYIYIDGTTRVPTAALVAPPDSALPLAIVVTDGAAIWYLHEARNFVTYPFQRLHNYLLDTRKIQIKSGITTQQGSTPVKIDVGSGVYYRATTEISYPGAADATFGYYYNSGLTEIPAQTNINITQYDNAGVLTLMAAGFFRADTSYVTSDGQVVVVFGTAEYANQQLAEDAGVNAPPSVAEQSACRSGLIIVEQGVGIANVIDVRPSGEAITGTGGGAGVTDHGDLTGLAADDHLQYLLVSGTRAMTGDLDMGINAITNAGLINTVNIEAHAIRHQPGGIDAIATVAAGTIAVGDAAAEGVAASISRSDHTHALPAPAAPANVTKAAASAGVATTVARADHKHDVTTAAAANVGQANAEGVSASLSRADHVHKGSLVQSQQTITGNTNTNSAAFVDLLTANINTGVGFLLITFTAACSVNSEQARQISFQILVDGVVQVATAALVTNGLSNTAAVQWRVACAAGAHVVKAQWKTSGSQAQIQPASRSEHANLRVEEVLY